MQESVGVNPSHFVVPLQAANTVQQEREEENRHANRKQRREKGKSSIKDRGSGKTRKSPSFGKKGGSKKGGSKKGK